MRKFLRLFTSVKTTMVLLVILAELFLVHVLVPQIDIVGAETLMRWIGNSRVRHFIMFTLGFADLPTSPIFLSLVALFFMNLAAVLMARLAPTLKRVRFNPPSQSRLAAWVQKPDALNLALPEAFNDNTAARALRARGYRVVRPSAGCVWGIKHRTAALGFLLFHFSFFLFFAGGALLYYTRFAGGVALAEGQDFDPAAMNIIRQAPYGRPPMPSFSLERVEPEIEAGVPTQLYATLDFADEDAQTSYINHPAEWGAMILMVERAGIAPVLWVQDARGYTVDRVLIMVSQNQVDAPVTKLVGDSLDVRIEPISWERGFPLRTELARTTLDVAVRDVDTVLFKGKLRVGDVVPIGPYFLRLDELRYWASLRLISEYGGGVLIVGFIFAVVGLLWRMFFFRREVGIVWDDATVRLNGRSEYFPHVFREELTALAGELERDPAS